MMNAKMFPLGEYSATMNSCGAPTIFAREEEVREPTQEDLIDQTRFLDTGLRKRWVTLCFETPALEAEFQAYSEQFRTPALSLVGICCILMCVAGIALIENTAARYPLALILVLIVVATASLFGKYFVKSKAPEEDKHPSTTPTTTATDIGGSTSTKELDDSEEKNKKSFYRTRALQARVQEISSAVLLASMILGISFAAYSLLEACQRDSVSFQDTTPDERRNLCYNVIFPYFFLTLAFFALCGKPRAFLFVPVAVASVFLRYAFRFLAPWDSTSDLPLRITIDFLLTFVIVLCYVAREINMRKLFEQHVRLYNQMQILVPACQQTVFACQELMPPKIRPVLLTMPVTHIYRQEQVTVLICQVPRFSRVNGMRNVVNPRSLFRFFDQVNTFLKSSDRVVKMSSRHDTITVSSNLIFENPLHTLDIFVAAMKILEIATPTVAAPLGGGPLEIDSAFAHHDPQAGFSPRAPSGGSSLPTGVLPAPATEGEPESSRFVGSTSSAFSVATNTQDPSEEQDNSPIPVQIGIHCGHAVACLTGTESRVLQLGGRAFEICEQISKVAESRKVTTSKETAERIQAAEEFVCHPYSEGTKIYSGDYSTLLYEVQKADCGNTAATIEGMGGSSSTGGGINIHTHLTHRRSTGDPVVEEEASPTARIHQDEHHQHHRQQEQNPMMLPPCEMPHSEEREEDFVDIQQDSQPLDERSEDDSIEQKVYLLMSAPEKLGSLREDHQEAVTVLKRLLVGKSELIESMVSHEDEDIDIFRSNFDSALKASSPSDGFLPFISLHFANERIEQRFVPVPSKIDEISCLVGQACVAVILIFVLVILEDIDTMRGISLGLFSFAFVCCAVSAVLLMLVKAYRIPHSILLLLTLHSLLAGCALSRPSYIGSNLVYLFSLLLVPTIYSCQLFPWKIGLGVFIFGLAVPVIVYTFILDGIFRTTDFFAILVSIPVVVFGLWSQERDQRRRFYVQLLEDTLLDAKKHVRGALKWAIIAAFPSPLRHTAMYHASHCVQSPSVQPISFLSTVVIAVKFPSPITVEKLDCSITATSTSITDPTPSAEASASPSSAVNASSRILLSTPATTVVIQSSEHGSVSYNNQEEMHGGGEKGGGRSSLLSPTSGRVNNSGDSLLPISAQMGPSAAFHHAPASAAVERESALVCSALEQQLQWLQNIHRKNMFPISHFADTAVLAGPLRETDEAELASTAVESIRILRSLPPGVTAVVSFSTAKIVVGGHDSSFPSFVFTGSAPALAMSMLDAAPPRTICAMDAFATLYKSSLRQLGESEDFSVDWGPVSKWKMRGEGRILACSLHFSEKK